MNIFSYYITTHFIPSNKDYDSYRNPHSVYQTYPKKFILGIGNIQSHVPCFDNNTNKGNK